MRLSSFEVENFRSIRERVKLDDLGELVVLHGANNAGKTNLLLAVRLFWFVVGELVRRNSDISRSTTMDLRHLSLPRSIAHRDRLSDPTTIRVTTSHPQGDPRGGLDATMNLSFVEGGLSVQLGEVAWTGRSRLRGEGVRKGADVEAAIVFRELPVEVFWHLDDERRHPDGRARSWDAWLMANNDQDTSGRSGRLWWRRVQDALRTFAPELGRGRLDRVADVNGSGGPELAWEDEDGVVVPFSDQGSGLRALKDVLIAALATPHPIVAIEEPETHLSEDAQLRLRGILREAAARYGKQLLLTSHVYAFDEPGQGWRIVREGAATRVERRPLESVSDSGAAVLTAEYAAAGTPTAGWVAASGIMRLPPSVREAMAGEGYLTFAPMDDGTFKAVPPSVMRAWADAEAGEG